MMQVIINRIDAQLKATAVGGPLVVCSDEEFIGLDLENTVHFTTYNGPAPGLKARTPGEKLPSIHVSRDYYPRPLMNAPSISSEGQAPEKPSVTFHGRHVVPMVAKETARNLSESLPPVHAEPAGLTEQETVRETRPEEYVERWIRDDETGQVPEFEETLKEEVIEDTPNVEATTPDSKIRMPRMNELVRDTFSQEDIEIANTAWRYFVFNSQPNTGMVNAVHNYPYATMWDTASALAASIATEKLGLISIREFEERATRLLETLFSVELYNQELPNREYNTRTGRMTDLKNRPSDKGSGWSALDIGRLLIWLKITGDWYPGMKDLITRVVDRWQFDRVCLYQELNGVIFDGNKERLRQEGRLGYEQYSATGYQLWGHDVPKALDYEDVKWMDMYGKKIPFDIRNNAYLTSDPFIFSKMELGGLDKDFDKIIRDIYEV